MSEWRQHSNPWAEKLSQVSLPDGGDSWKAMEAVLDREMPTSRRRDWRRWFLLVLLLLLLIGVCNCPGRKRFSAITTKSQGPIPSRGGPSAGTPVHVTSTETRGHVTPPPVGPSRPADASTPVLKGATPATGSLQNDNFPVKPAVKNRQPKTGGPGAKPDISQSSASQPVDSAHRKLMPPAPNDQPKKERQDGWMVGIGLNQFFTVGGQQASSFNSGGITGTLGDYIPVPMVRYYDNPKLYVQLEAQINTPQYTKKNLVAVSTPVDSIGTTAVGGVVTLQQSVAINKLFYFNLPLSLHYTVFGHVDFGTGLQYSRLTNGVGVFNSNYGRNGFDSLETSETKSFKGDSVYKKIKTHEFRFLVDANYTWQHFIFGIRYNQALSKFIHVEISPGQVTQARNSSLQLYLRYILWDGRKKKPLLPAK